jgi:type IV secretory pathway VirB2 component (pilin)
LLHPGFDGLSAVTRHSPCLFEDVVPMLVRLCVAVLAIGQSSFAIAQTVMPADPQGSGPILAALTWMQNTLLGNVATTAAVIAVAVVGLMMLTGRINWRFGATVVFGTFILFGATSIVAGIRSVAG